MYVYLSLFWIQHSKPYSCIWITVNQVGATIYSHFLVSLLNKSERSAGSILFCFFYLKSHHPTHYFISLLPSFWSIYTILLLTPLSPLNYNSTYFFHIFLLPILLHHILLSFPYINSTNFLLRLLPIQQLLTMACMNFCQKVHNIYFSSLLIYTYRQI